MKSKSLLHFHLALASTLWILSGCNSFSNSVYGGSQIAPLEVTLGRESSQPDATMSANAKFTAQFSHPIDDDSFLDSHLSNAGTATGITWSRTKIDDKTYSILAQFPATASGTIQPQLSSASIQSSTTKQILSSVISTNSEVVKQADQVRIKTASVGVQHACALSYDRRLFCWGQNGAGQLGTGDNTARSTPTEISLSFLLNGDYFESLTAGWFYTCGLTRLGEVWCWGDNGNGELGQGNTTNSNVPLKVDMSAHPTAGPFEKLALHGTGHICGITQKAALYCWGRDNSGQIGNGPATTTPELTPILVDVTSVPTNRKVKDVAVGNQHTCALFYDSLVYCWGQPGSGRLGNNDTSTTLHLPSVAVITSGFTGAPEAISLQTFSDHTCVLTSDRTIGCWGTNGTYPVFGDGLGGTDRNTPSPLSMVALTQSRWLNYSTQSQSNCGLTSDFKVYCWGRGAQGEMGTGSLANVSTPSLQVDLSTLEDGATPATLIGGSEMVCLISSDSQLYCWGDNSNGLLADGTTTDSTIPKRIDFSSHVAPHTFKKITSGESHHCALDSQGRVFCWGENSQGQLGLGDALNRSVASLANTGAYRIVDLFLFKNSSCALNDRAQLMCWGANLNGQFKNGSTSSQLTPIHVSTASDLPFRKVISLAGHNDHLCGLFDSGEVYCWGNNSSGQLGDTTLTSRTQLMPIDTTNFAPYLVSQLTGSEGSHCLITSQSTSFCWGENSSGQLGVGTSSDSSTPVAQNTGSEFVKHLYQSASFGCFINTANAVHCWGLNTSLQLGRSGADINTPTAIDVTSVPTSGLRTLSLHLAEGAVLALNRHSTQPVSVWGSNSSSQFSDTVVSSTTAPIAATSSLGINIESLSLSETSTCGIIYDDGIKCWGTGPYGELAHSIGSIVSPNPIDASEF